MKKFFALALALALTLALAVTCFAAPETLETTGNKSASVKASYAAGGTASTVYSVDIEFGAMAFTYTSASEGTWDPDNHQFTGIVPAAWTCADGANNVTVTNHSNTDVDVTVAYAAAEGYTGITGTFTNNSYNLVSAVGKATDAAELTKVSTLTLNGALAAGTAANTVIGTVTVTIQ